MRTNGWQKVFSFTLIQHIKTKSFIIGTTIMCVIVALICVLTNVLPAVLMDDSELTPDSLLGGSSEEPAGFSSVYIYDEPSIFVNEDISALAEIAPWQIVFSERPLADVVEQLKTSEKPIAAAHIVASNNEDDRTVGYNITTYYSPSADGGSADRLNDVLEELINRRVLLNAGVLPENYADTQIWISSSRTEAGAKQWNFIQSAMNYFIPIVVSLVLFILIFSYGQVVAQSIATEKTSRVMELLLTSVRPLAVVIGKVFAMGAVSFGQFMLIGLVGGISFAVSAPFGWMGKAFELTRDPEIQQALAQAAQAGSTGVMTDEMQIAEAVGEFTQSFNPLNVILIILIFLLGFLFYSLIAALVGASISRMEDLQQAMQPYAITGVLGMYLAYFPVIFNIDSLETGEAVSNPVQIFSYFFPISSPFALPSAIMLGTLNTWQSLLGVAVLVAAAVLAAIVVSKVYEAIILHNGSRIKFGDILKMAVRK